MINFYVQFDAEIGGFSHSLSMLLKKLNPYPTKTDVDQ